MKKILSDEAKLNNGLPVAGGIVKDRDNQAIEEIVLPDECGDSLWDKVLQQEKKRIYPAGTCERNGLLNNIIAVQNDQKEHHSP